MKDLLNTSADFNEALREQHEAWLKRVDELETMLGKYTLERDMLRGKIAAAETLLGRPGPSGSYTVSVRVHIEELMGDMKARTAAEIRSGLRTMGVGSDRIKSTTGSFYTTLKRIVDSGKLTRNGPRYRWNPAFEITKRSSADAP